MSSDESSRSRAPALSCERVQEAKSRDALTLTPLAHTFFSREGELSRRSTRKVHRTLHARS
eukprot:1161287-Pleurochrysis_carterae.AAC.1